MMNKGKMIKHLSGEDPTWVSMEIRWHSQAPKYKSGIHVYVWQPHIDVPELERVTVHIDRSSANHWKVLLAWRLTEGSSAALPRAYLKEWKKQRRSRFNGPHSNITEITSAIFSIFRLLIRDTDAFLQTLSHEIAVLVSSTSRS
jgi:hypothetical protein